MLDCEAYVKAIGCHGEELLYGLRGNLDDLVCFILVIFSLSVCKMLRKTCVSKHCVVIPKVREYDWVQWIMPENN